MAHDTFDANTLFGHWAQRAADTALPTLLETLERHRVKRALTIAASGLFVDCIQGNDETLAACREHPQLEPIGTVDPRRWVGCREELKRLCDAGVRVIGFYPEWQEWSPESRAFRRLAEEAARLGQIVLCEATREGMVSRIANALSDVAGPVILSGVNYRTLAESIAVLEEREQWYLETHALGSLGAQEIVKDAVGIGRLLFGSRSPLQYYSSAWLPIRYASISDEERNCIFGGNLTALLERSRAHH